MERLSLQHITELFAKQSGLSKKAAEAITRTFFDTITQGLKADGLVRINGFGTFKLVEVAERESINVNNGERIVIPGYKKVTFVPADTAIDSTTGQTSEYVNQAEDRQEQPATTMNHPISQSEAASTADEQEDTSDDDEGTEVALDTPDISDIELPADEFSSIDIFISTPESIEEVRVQYEQARQHAAETLRIANTANAEMLRLEALLKRLEANTPPTTEPEKPEAEHAEDKDKDDAENTAATVLPAPEHQPSPTTSNETLQHYLNDKAIHDEDDKPERKSNWLWWLLIPITGLLLAEIAILLYKYTESHISPPTEQIAKPQQKASPRKAGQKQEAPANAEKAGKKSGTDKADTPEKPAETKRQPSSRQPDAPAVQPKPATKPAPAAHPGRKSRPKTYVMKPGDSLTKLSQKFYGTKDSVRAIIRVNNFPNPDNVPIGARIKLP